MKVTVDATRIGDVAREVERAQRVLAELQQHAIDGTPPGGYGWSQDYRDGLSIAYQNALEELRAVSQAVSRLSGWEGKARNPFTPAHLHIWTWDSLGVVEQCRGCGAVRPEGE